MQNKLAVNLFLHVKQFIHENPNQDYKQYSGLIIVEDGTQWIHGDEIENPLFKLTKDLGDIARPIDDNLWVESLSLIFNLTNIFNLFLTFASKL